MTTKAALGRAAHLLIVDKLITTPTPNGRRHTCSPWKEGLTIYVLITHIHPVYCLLRIIHANVSNMQNVALGHCGELVWKEGYKLSLTMYCATHS